MFESIRQFLSHLLLPNRDRQELEELQRQFELLVEDNHSKQSQIDACRTKTTQLQVILKEYNDSFNKEIDKNQLLSKDLEQITGAFRELLLKYEKARAVIQGLMANEDVLKGELKKYQELMERLKAHENVAKSNKKKKYIHAKK